MLQSKEYNYFRTAVWVSLFLAMCLGIFIAFLGKTSSFLLLHNFHSPAADYFFWTLTYLGDGVIIIPILLFCLLFKKKEYILPIILGFVICVILTHLLKRVFFPDALRPISLEIENLTLRRVLGTELFRARSFPSGHTSIAFAMALMLVHLMNNKAMAYILPIVAFLVGYSRIYLGQHFTTDVLVGIIIGIVSPILAIFISNKIHAARARKKAANLSN